METGTGMGVDSTAMELALEMETGADSTTMELVPEMETGADSTAKAMEPVPEMEVDSTAKAKGKSWIGRTRIRPRRKWILRTEVAWKWPQQSAMTRGVDLPRFGGDGRVKVLNGLEAWDLGH